MFRVIVKIEKYAPDTKDEAGEFDKDVSACDFGMYETCLEATHVFDKACDAAEKADESL